MARINGSEIRPGMVIEHDGSVWVAIKTMAVKPGKGPAYNQVELKNLIDGRKLNHRFGADERVDETHLERRTFQFLYRQGDSLVFMDNDSYEQIELAQEFVGERAAFLQDGMAVTVSLHGGRPIGIRLPEHVVLEVTEADAVINLEHRPGHFIVQGHPFATVWPPAAAGRVTEALGLAHITGPNRTLTQDISFGIDQLVEIAIRALSPAVNDTFTALTCIDWLADALCKIAVRWYPARVHRDRAGFIRVITADPSYERLVQRGFEKIRQASEAMPAVMIRQLEALIKIIADTTETEQRQVLLDQAAMISRACERSVLEESDRTDVQRRYMELLAAVDRTAPSVDGVPG